VAAVAPPGRRGHLDKQLAVGDGAELAAGLLAYAHDEPSPPPSPAAPAPAQVVRVPRQGSQGAHGTELLATAPPLRALAQCDAAIRQETG
jgi:hypothetical protein